MSTDPATYPDSFFEGSRGNSRTDNSDLPADALVLPPVLNRKPYSEER